MGEIVDLGAAHVLPWAIGICVVLAIPIALWLLSRGWWARPALAAGLAVPAAVELGVWWAVDRWGAWSLGAAASYAALAMIASWVARDAGLREFSAGRAALLALAGGGLGMCLHEQATSEWLVGVGSAVVLALSLGGYAVGRRTVRRWERERRERVRVERLEDERAKEAARLAGLVAAEQRERADREHARREKERLAEEAERSAKKLAEEQSAQAAREEERRLAAAEEIAIASSVREDEIARRSLRDLVGRERSVLEALYMLADGRTSTKVSLAALSARAGLSLAQCQRSCRQLAERDQVRVQDEWNRTDWHDRSVWMTTKGSEAVGRQLEAAQAMSNGIAAPPGEVTHQLVVLYLTASPREEAVVDADGNLSTSALQRLRVDHEFKSVKSVLLASTLAGHIRLEHAPAASFDDLVVGLNHYAPHVVNFSGHSGSDGIVLDSDQLNGPGRILYFRTLRRLMAASAEPPKLLVLNSCDSLSGADKLLAAVEIVIGMPSYTVEIAAIAFAQRFYGALAADKSIQDALDQGNAALEYTMPEGVAYQEPEIRARPGIDLKTYYLLANSRGRQPRDERP